MEFLYIFPDVHIWADKTNLLFFDTRNQKNIKVALNGQNLQLYEDLTDVRNLYCVELRQDNRDEALLNELIREGFGKVLQTDCMHRPIAIPPYHILKERFSVGGKRYFPRVLDYTKTLTVHLGGCCKKSCSHCTSLYKQVHYCTQEATPLTANNMQTLQSRINALNNLERINILVSSEEMSLLSASALLHKEGVPAIYHVYWRNISKEMISFISSMSRSLIKVLVDLSEISDEQLNALCRLQQENENLIVLAFCVTSIDDWVLLERHLENTVKDNIEIKTISVGDNKEHINQLYLLVESEILEQETDHNRIYGNRELNFALFGELVVHPDGTVRLNENTEVIGSIEDDWTEMLNKALNKPNPWLMTRGKTKPCSNCIYRDLCPPIRNLELYMGDKLACVDYYKTLPKQDIAN